MISTNKQYQEKFKEMKQIGKGTVYLINHVQSNEQFVAKKINLQGLNYEEQQRALQEANLLKSLNHPHIVKYLHSFLDKQELVIIMEHCSEGDLAKHIVRCQNKKQKFPEELILNWFLQILLGIEYIHGLKIIHRDLKASNMFLTSDGIVKIGDFGISKILLETQQNAQTIVGTPYYLSPEICNSLPYSFNSDIWALGCILQELCTHKKPFQSNNILGLVKMILEGQQEIIPTCYSKELQNLINIMLIKDQFQRPSVQDLLNNEFIKKMMKQFRMIQEENNIVQSILINKQTQVETQDLKTDLLQIQQKQISSKSIENEIIPDMTLHSYKVISGDLSMENTVPFSYSLTQIQKDLQEEFQKQSQIKYPTKESIVFSKDLEEYNSEKSSEKEI